MQCLYYSRSRRVGRRVFGGAKNQETIVAEYGAQSASITTSERENGGEIMTFGNFKAIVVTLAAVGLLAGKAATAQEVSVSGDDDERRGDVLEEIVVTADLRDKNLQDVALSVSVISGKALEEQMLDELDDWSDAVPGLTYSEIGAGARGGANIVIRGVANSAVLDSRTSTKTTSMYIDDVPIQAVDARLFDVNRIEVLKGPQGTLFGQASMGGTVRIITNKPDTTATYGRFKVSTGVTKGDSGNLDSPSYSGDVMLNLPLIDNKLAIRGVVSSRSEGGWVDMERTELNLGAAKGDPDRVARDIDYVADQPDLSNVNNSKSLTIRLAAEYSPTERLSILPTYIYQSRESDSNDSYDRNLNKGLYVDTYLETPKAEEFEIVSLVLTYDFGFAELTGIFAETNRTFKATQDVTQQCSLSHGLNVDGSIPALCPLDFKSDNDLATNELRLNGSFGWLSDSATVNWVLGASHVRERGINSILWQAQGWNANADNGNFITHPDDLRIRLQTTDNIHKNLSFFGDVELELDNWSFAVGARRYDQEAYSTKEFYLEGSVFGSTLTDPNSRSNPANTTGPFLNEQGTTPRATIGYSVTDDVLVHATYSEGFRRGAPGSATTNPLYLTPECQSALALAGLPLDFKGKLDSDSVQNTELGIKSRWMDGRVQVNGAVYHISWTDLQKQLELSQLTPGCGLSPIVNVGEAEIDGVDLEVDALIGDNITIGATLSYIDAAVSKAPTGAVFEVGDPIGGVPEWSGSARFQYNWALPGNFDGSFRVNYYYRGDIIGPNFVEATDPFVQHGDYELVNLQFSTTREEWGRLTVFVNNVFDQVADIGGGPLPGEPFTNRVLVKRPFNFGLEYSRDF